MATIGVYDSGVGGLSVLREAIELLPREKYVYYADNAWCPYGEKDAATVIRRAEVVTDILLERGAEIIVVACNTATAAAIGTLRGEYAPLKFIGMEPAIKPAALGTRTGVVGVLATAGTISSTRYLLHKEKLSENVRIVESVGRGFVELVERGVLDGSEAEDTVARSVNPLVDAGADRIVLGCTHYPFLRDVIQRVAGPGVELIDPAPAVARQLRRVLVSEGLPRGDSEADVTLLSSGDDAVLREMFLNYL